MRAKKREQLETLGDEVQSPYFWACAQHLEILVLPVIGGIHAQLW